MKTKLIKRTLAAIAVLAFGLAFVFAAVTGKTGGVAVHAEEGVKGYNVLNVNSYNFPNKNVVSIINPIFGREDDHDVLSINSTGNVESQNIQYFIKWEKDVSYTISFSVKTVAVSSVKSWFIYPRVSLNGNMTNYFNNGVGNAKGVCEDWTEFSWEYTATEDGKSSDFIYLTFGFFNGDQIKIRDISVAMAADTFASKKDVAIGGIKAARGTSSSLTKTTATDGAYGTVNVLTYKGAVSGNDVYWKDDMKWTFGATYTVYFMIRTGEGSTVKAYLATRHNGGNYNTIVTRENCINGAEIIGWKPVTATFTFDDSFNQGASGVNALALIMEGGKEGDVVYYTDIKVFGNVSSVNKVTDGKTVTENVITGSEYTIAENPVVANKTVVGWDYNGALKVANDKITVSEDVSLNAVVIDYTVEDGAYIRLAEDSGLRFIANISKEAIAVLKKYGNVEFGMRFTSDNEVSLGGEFDVKTNKWASDETAENKQFYTALTGFTAENNFYGVKFTAQAYAKIYDADGKLIATALSESTCTRSVSDVANAALNAENEKPGTYTGAQLEIINALTGK